MPSFPYTFRLPVKEYQRKINANFIIINETIKPFDFSNVIIYHYEKGRSYTTKDTHDIANVTPKNNQLELSFYHLIWEGYDNISYIDVVVTPKKRLQI